MKSISKHHSSALRIAAAVVLLQACQPALAAASKHNRFSAVEWKGWKVLSSSRQFDRPQSATFNEMFLGALAKARQDLHVKGDAPDFGEKQIAAAAQVNKDYAADVLSRPHFRVWLDAVESGKLDDLVGGEVGWAYYVTRKNPLPQAAFPLIYNSFDLPGGRRLGVSVLNSGAYDVPDPGSRVGAAARCWAGNGAGAGDEIMECPAKAYLVEPDGRISQGVDFTACFVEFGDTSGGSPERDSISAAFDARRGQVAVLTTIGGAHGRRPIMTGGPDECGPIVVSVPFAKD